jgi:hypothetical protein
MFESKIRNVLFIGSILVVIAGAILASIAANASELTTPNVFTSGTPALASEVNENFSAIEAAVNDNDGRIAAMEGAGGAATFQVSNAIVFGTGEVVPGAGTLLREPNAVELRAELSGLDANAAYTMWWIIFNNPGECTTGGELAACGEGDLNPDRDGEGVNPVDRGVRHVAGFITGMAGTANVRSRLRMGAHPTGPAVAGFGQLNDTVGAEVHIVIQTHGSPLVGSVADQMTTPGAACNTVCEDQFAIVFLPVPVAAP